MASVRVRPPALARLEGLLDVGPELFDVLEADAEPDEVVWDASALPAGPRLQHGIRPAEARGVLDQPRRGLDAARRGSTAGDVERHQPAEAGIAHALHCRVGLQAAGEFLRVSGDALHA